MLGLVSERSERKAINMKNILITAAGTATAWHIVNVINSDFRDNYRVFACDINPVDLIPASLLVDKYIQVPKINDEKYYQFMLNLLEENNIDIIIPLIDNDFKVFPKDNPDLQKLNVFSTAPDFKVSELCTNKKVLNKHLDKYGIKTPIQYEKEQIVNQNMYFVKPCFGYGSNGATDLYGYEINTMDHNLLIQEKCRQPEVTVEVFCHNGELQYVCRERLETKAGVCTKARFFHDEELGTIIKNIAKLIELPTASCIQFMKNNDDEWVVTDLNLRLGAGTALSTAAGWSLVKAALCVWCQLPNDSIGYLNNVNGKTVVRVYKEIVMNDEKINWS